MAKLILIHGGSQLHVTSLSGEEPAPVESLENSHNSQATIDLGHMS